MNLINRSGTDVFEFRTFFGAKVMILNIFIRRK